MLSGIPPPLFLILSKAFIAVLEDTVPEIIGSNRVQIKVSLGLCILNQLFHLKKKRGGMQTDPVFL